MVYPNPAKDQITVFYDFENNKNNTLVELTDISGKVVLQQKLFFNENEVIVSLEGVPSGFYVATIKQNNIVLGATKLAKK